MKYVIGYLYNIMVLLSKAINTILGGTPHESLSEKLGRRFYLEGKEHYAIPVLIVNAIFFWEHNHIANAINDENNSKDLWDL